MHASIDTGIPMPSSIAGTEESEELPLPTEEQKHEKPQNETSPSDAHPVQAVLGELKVSSVTPSSVGLQWSVPEGSFDSFMLQYRDAQGQPKALAIDGGSRSVMVPGLSPSRRYRFHLYGLQGRKKTDRVSIDIITGEMEGQRDGWIDGWIKRWMNQEIQPPFHPHMLSSNLGTTQSTIDH